MTFKPSLWDNSDPSYAPFLKLIKGKYYKWIPTPKYIKAGWNRRSVPLVGEPGDGLDDLRAAECRRMTRRLLTWFEEATRSKTIAGTWGWLIERYETDEFSPIHDTKASTRAGYIKHLSVVRSEVGDTLLSATDHTQMMMWKREWEQKSPAYVRKMFGKLRLISGYGVMLGDPEATRIKGILSQMRIKQSPSRNVIVTRDQVEKIVSYADSKGLRHLSLSVLFQFTYMLRGVDIHGQWMEGTGGIQHNGKRWEDGLTWDMFAPDLSSFTKVISKTAGSMPEPYVFDLTAELRQRLSETPQERRIGPVVVVKDGTPPKEGRLSHSFRAARDALSLPEDIQMRDLRSGAITEARGMVSPMELRNAAQHRDIATTNGYVRSRSEDANKVVRLRQGGK